MIYSIEQVQRGLTSYIDNEITSKLTGFSKWTVGALGALYASKLPEIVEKAKSTPAVSVLGIFPEGGGIDVDCIYSAIKPQADRCPVTFDAPIIGSVTLNSQDVDNIYNSIRNS